MEWPLCCITSLDCCQEQRENRKEQFCAACGSMVPASATDKMWLTVTYVVLEELQNCESFNLSVFMEHL